jgi:UDP-3-O-[3-hydroxymyristoyl] N-acetylglucosamine deacetylase
VIYERRTLREAVRFEGLGLHTGLPVRVTVHPGSEGIAFRYGSVRTPARPENVTDTTRSTRLGEVGTVEHLMSALGGLEITDAEVEVSAPEMPGLDGSARPYAEALVTAGFEGLGTVESPSLFQRVFLPENGVRLAVAKGEGHWRYTYAIDGRWPNEQVYETANVVADYAAEIAPARTFALAEEIPQLIQLGLGRGLDEESAVVVGIEGYKNGVRFDDELARHKLLDLMGDLYLAGVPLRFLNVAAERTGHRSHVQIAAMLAEAVSERPPAQA